MVQLNLALREINCKVVYFGCGLGGKTTNLEIVHQKADEGSRGELTSIATESDRTLFFDFMPLDLGEVSGMRVKFQLYTVPGQVYYNSTRKLVLRGADGVILVADSQRSKLDENIESLENLEECLNEQGRSLDEMPHVIQFNKRDLDDILSMEELSKALNHHGAPVHGAVAMSGEGVLETFKTLAGIMLEKVKAMSTASKSKPSPQSAPKSPPSSAPKPITDVQRLQGGLSSSPQPPSPARVENRLIDEKRPAAAAKSPAPQPAPQPAPTTATMAPPRPEPVAPEPRVRPSVRETGHTPSAPQRVITTGSQRMTGPITTNGFQAVGTQGSMMVSSVSRRKKRGGSMILTVAVTALVAVAATAAAFFFFLD